MGKRAAQANISTPQNGTPPDAGKARRYLENQIKTASKDQLLLLLVDGALRYSQRGRDALAAKNIGAAHDDLIRAQRILLELIGALSKEMGEELYNNLSGLYGFVYLRLVKANLKHEPALVDEALRILEHVRETWRQAVEKLQDDRKREATPAAVPAPVGAAPQAPKEFSA